MPVYEGHDTQYRSCWKALGFTFGDFQQFVIGMWIGAPSARLHERQ